MLLQDYAAHLKRLREQLAQEATPALSPPSEPLPAAADHSRGRLPADGTDSGGGSTKGYFSWNAETERALRAPLDDRDGDRSHNSQRSFSPPARSSSGPSIGPLPFATGLLSIPSGDERHREILAEVEALSRTVTQLHRERSEVDDKWSARLRELRKDLQEKCRSLEACEARRSELEAMMVDLKTQNAALRRELHRQSKEVESSRQSLAASNQQFHQVAKLLADAEEREKLLRSQEQMLLEAERRAEAAHASAMEWESRYSRAQRDNEAQETAWQRRADALGGVISSLGGWLVRTLEELGSEVCDKLSAELDEAGPEEHMPTRAKGACRGNRSF